MLNEFRDTVFGVRHDSRMDSVRLASKTDIRNCLILVNSFGAAACLAEKIGTIKAIRELSDDSISLKHAKNLVEVVCEACQEEPNASECLLEEFDRFFF